MSQTEPIPDLELWANYHDLDPLAYNQAKDVWPERNAELHVGELAATPRIEPLSDPPADPPDGALWRTPNGLLFQFVAGSWALFRERRLPGSIVLRAYDDDRGETYRRGGFATIQDAISAMPLQKNEYAPDARTGGDVLIYSKATDANSYEEGRIVMDRKGLIRGVGIFAEISHTSDTEATMLVDEVAGGPPSPDDVYLRYLWLENLGGGPALRSTQDETHLQDLDIEAAGDVGVLLQGDRCTATRMENKGGSVKLTGDQGYYNQILSHDEIDEGFVYGFEIAGNYNNLVNCHGWLQGTGDGPGKTGVLITGGKNTFVGSAGESPKRINSGRLDYGIDLKGDNNHVMATVWKVANALHIGGANNFAQIDTTNVSTNGVMFGSASADNVVEGVLSAPISWNGARNVVNGVSVNDGDPTSTGAWNGNADLAFRRGVTVWDITSNTAYEAGPGGWA